MSNSKNELQLIKTGDGSHTLYNTRLEEHYHSQHGSLQESEHVFIRNGLEIKASKSNSIMVLEIGFGTGLNALLAVLNKNNAEIRYTGLEPFPIGQDIIDQLNFTELEKEGSLGLFQKIHQTEWEQVHWVTSHFQLLKSKSTIQEFESEEMFDLVFFDAFAPRPQPEMWTLEVFKKVYSLMNDKAILVTYCAKGEVRRTLIEAGFICERLPGPPGKREMLRATKNG